MSLAWIGRSSDSILYFVHGNSCLEMIKQFVDRTDKHECAKTLNFNRQNGAK